MGFEEIVLMAWILIPAYAANAAPPLAKGKRPIDLGARFIDGHRLFGDGKTLRGFATGVAVGGVVGIALTFVNVGLPLTLGLLAGLGAMTGDLLGSFVRRRMNLPRGQSPLLLNRIDFLIGALLFCALVWPITLFGAAFAFVVTPAIHKAACVFGYKIGVKEVPW